MGKMKTEVKHHVIVVTGVQVSSDLDNASRNSQFKCLLNAIKPVFEALSTGSLLSKCTNVEDKTQMTPLPPSDTNRLH